MEFFHALFDLLDRHTHLGSKVLLGLVFVRQEFVQRRIEETDGGRKALELLEHADKVAPLKGKNLGQGLFAIVLGVGEDHFAHGIDAVAFEEHVLSATETDARSAKRNGVGCLLRSIRVGANLQLGHLGTPIHQLLEHLIDRGVLRVERFFDKNLYDFRSGGRELARIDTAQSAVNRKPIAFFIDHALNGHGLGGVINLQRARAADADFAHLTGNEGRVRTDAAFGGQDAFSRDHAAEIFRRGFVAHEQDFFALLSSDDSSVGIEIDLAGSSARTRRETRGNDFGRFLSLDVEDRSQELIKLIGRIAFDGCLPVDEFLIDHVDGELQRGESGALAVARLEHEDFAFLNGELKILHVFEVRFEGFADAFEFSERLGHLVLELGNRFGSADAGNDVFALGVDEKFTIEFLVAVGGIAGERNARTRGFAGVAIDHRLDSDGGSPFVGDAIFAAINNRAVVHPRAEHSADSAHQLLPRILREFTVGAFFDEGLKAGHHFLEIINCQLGVFDVFVMAFVFELMQHHFKGFIIFTGALLHTHDDVAIHLDEAAVTVPGKTLILGGCDESEHCLIVQTEVENGIHHARH